MKARGILNIMRGLVALPNSKKEKETVFDAFFKSTKNVLRVSNHPNFTRKSSLFFSERKSKSVKSLFFVYYVEMFVRS